MNVAFAFGDVTGKSIRKENGRERRIQLRTYE
jgi:hypothetical protein